MRRIGLVAAIWLVFVGGVAGYMRQRDVHRQARSTPIDVPAAAAARYDLELTFTFDAQPDPFALVTDASQAPPIATVRVNGQPVAELRTGPPPGVAWRKEGIEGVAAGTNEVLVEATPPATVADVAHGVRLRVFENGQPIADETLWSEGGGRVLGTVQFTVSETGSEDAHAH